MKKSLAIATSLFLSMGPIAAAHAASESPAAKHEHMSNANKHKVDDTKVKKSEEVEKAATPAQSQENKIPGDKSLEDGYVEGQDKALEEAAPSGGSDSDEQSDMGSRDEKF